MLRSNEVLNYCSKTDEKITTEVNLPEYKSYQCNPSNIDVIYIKDKASYSSFFSPKSP